jgi:hypothetical protein
MVTESSEITAVGELTETADVTSEVTSAGETASTPESTAGSIPLPRQSITLPTDLPVTVQITGSRLLSDAIEDVLPVAAELSPDGSLVAWLEPEQPRGLATLCIADVSGAGQNCFTAAGYQGLPYHLVWSPDSNWLAFSEDPAAQALESDIWLFDTVKGEAVNRTDDMAMGRYAEVEGDFALDYLPMWDPATGYLYFWRSIPDGLGGFDLSLMRLDPTAGAEPEVVRTFDKSFSDGMVRFGWQRFYLQGPTAIAPDGSQLAVAMAPAQEMDLSESQALWLIDLVNDDVEPTQVATSLAWQTALPQWSNQPAVVRGLQWTADGEGIVVAALSSDLRLPLLLAYYVDVAAGEVEPLVDFSDSRDRDAFFRLDTAGHAPRFDVPWTLALAPNANVLLMVTDMGGVVRILGAPLPPVDAAPQVLHERLSPGYEVWTRSSSGENGTVLVYGLLVESVAQE